MTSARKLPKGVKATTGGTFDPDAPHAYFLAGNLASLIDNPHPNVLVAVNEVRGARELEDLDRLLDSGKRVMIDSGIFNLAMSHARAHDVSMDVALSLAPEEIDGFPELWEDYGRVVQHCGERLWGAVELDQGGVANKPRTRKRIEDEFGIVPMPVYHPFLDGWDYYDDLAKGYDRLCFGNIVKASPPVRLRLAYTAAERSKAYPYLWTHLLGMTPNQNLLAMPYRGSCDSSSWLAAVRWQPNWKGSTMLAATSKYPPTMWDVTYTNTGGANLRDKSYALMGVVAANLQRTIDSLREDTHPTC